eukprot:c6213_g1_i1.p1 GENE.c6213_g1_i1~~c6213_g1_i1.p1  ORF type:complete len:138 (+),score=32.65 c6213_g1_i1:378-791(+)
MDENGHDDEESAANAHLPDWFRSKHHNASASGKSSRSRGVRDSSGGDERSLDVQTYMECYDEMLKNTNGNTSTNSNGIPESSMSGSRYVEGDDLILTVQGNPRRFYEISEPELELMDDKEYQKYFETYTRLFPTAIE